MLLKKIRRAQRSVPVTLSPPIGGLNGRDGRANMPAQDAFVLDNMFPSNTTVNTRNGSLDFATGIASDVQSLEVFTGGTGAKLLAFGDGKAYNVTAGGAVGAAVKSGLNSTKTVSCMFSNAGAQYLLGLTGADAPFAWDGTTWTDLTITGLTGSQNTLHANCTFKGRVFLAQYQQLGFYYLAVGAIQGAASYFDLSQIARNGGYLAGMGTFSADSGSGPADYMVFMTSEGEYIVYSGTDPSNAATWALVGRYYTSAPIGRKGWFNFGDDLFIICNLGVIPFSQIRAQGGDKGIGGAAITAKLGTNITELNSNSTVHGWCGVVYPRSKMLVINAPASPSVDGDYYQFVMNTDTNAWCRFKGWNGQCWAVFNERLYFGTVDGTVVKADDGTDDNGTEIICECRQADNYFDDGRGMGASDKQFHFVTFVVQADGTPAISAEMTVNFQDDQPSAVASLAPAEGATWDTATWDVDGWGSSGITQTVTIPLGKLGYVGSIWWRCAMSSEPLKWYGSRVVLEKAYGLSLL